MQEKEIRARVLDSYPPLTFERRKQINDAVFTNPERNYIFSGSGGIGKSYLASAIADVARLYGYKILRTNGPQWEAELRSNALADIGEKRVLEISAESLRRIPPAILIFDEVTRLSKTEFVTNAFQDLLDAIKQGGHQLIATSNSFSREEFSQAIGDSLSWRLLRKDEGLHGGLGCVFVAFQEKN